MIPKTEKLAKEEACRHEKPCAHETEKAVKNAKTANQSVIIKKIKMLNEFVAVKLFEHESELALPEERRFRNEGIVVGVGAGLPDGSGGRCESQLTIGDVVLVPEKNILTTLNIVGHPYDNAKIVVVSERNIICKMEPVYFEVLE
jgi:co-chaperonin GroES (HSP10)